MIFIKILFTGIIFLKKNRLTFRSKNFIAVSGRCAHFFDYIDQSDGTGKLGINIEKSIEELNVEKNNFYIFDTCNMGPLLIDKSKLMEMNYLDEKIIF